MAYGMGDDIEDMTAEIKKLEAENAKLKAQVERLSPIDEETGLSMLEAEAGSNELYIVQLKSQLEEMVRLADHRLEENVELVAENNSFLQMIADQIAFTGTVQAERDELKATGERLLKELKFSEENAEAEHKEWLDAIGELHALRVICGEEADELEANHTSVRVGSIVIDNLRAEAAKNNK